MSDFLFLCVSILQVVVFRGILPFYLDFKSVGVQLYRYNILLL